ncbi:uncharacterized protein EV420DRAFT_735723 [Desarmillaria tabescens]|uniref:Uncharacterized protein n=1 Tax=Armillaria tabescens TaxID=1929756 RepID=A0AA39JWZ6_ARMTA|nr:uncharacterized protein EV420DRAFT_735723 [Desarmillaria tabescens]KAK0450456.1 hypothetical protein EV420DRAFT_735723 [Desarmillaria tabescens]
MTETAPLYASGQFDAVDQEGEYLNVGDISLHETDYMETSLTSDDEDEDDENENENEEDEDEDVGFQAALAASTLEMENTRKQEELELQQAIEASNDVDQDVKLTLDTERAIEMSLEQERTLEEMRKAQEEDFLGHFAAESSSILSFDRPSYTSSVSTLLTGGTGSQSRHHPFLSPPASVISNRNASVSSASRYNSREANIPVPIGSDSSATVTDIDISAYPPPNLSPTASTNWELMAEKGDPVSVSVPGQTSSSSPATSKREREYKIPLPNSLPSNIGPDSLNTEDDAPFPEVQDGHPTPPKPQHERLFSSSRLSNNTDTGCGRYRSDNYTCEARR